MDRMLEYIGMSPPQEDSAVENLKPTGGSDMIYITLEFIDIPGRFTEITLAELNS